MRNFCISKKAIKKVKRAGENLKKRKKERRKKVRRARDGRAHLSSQHLRQRLVGLCGFQVSLVNTVHSKTATAL